MSKQPGDMNNYPSMPMPSAPPSYEQAVGGHPGNIGFVQNQMQAQGYTGGQMYPTVPPHPSAAKYAPAPDAPQPESIPTTIVITRQAPGFAPGPRPMRITCPNCHQNILTATETDCLCAAHFCCLALFLVGLGLCSCLPYCMDSCKSVSHHCPNCKVDLGTYVPS